MLARHACAKNKFRDAKRGSKTIPACCCCCCCGQTGAFLCTQRTGHHIRFLTCQITNPRQHRRYVIAIFYPSVVERWLSIPFTQPIGRSVARSYFQLLFRMTCVFCGTRRLFLCPHRERASPTSVQNSSTIGREMPGAFRGVDTYVNNLDHTRGFTRCFAVKKI